MINLRCYSKPDSENARTERLCIFQNAAGVFLSVLSLLFMSIEMLSGIFGILAILMFIIAARNAVTAKRILHFAVSMWLGLSIRNMLLFGLNPLYMLAVSLTLIPIVLVFTGAALIDNKLRKRGFGFFAAFVFPVAATLVCMAMVLLNLGNNYNTMTYVMCIPLMTGNLTVFGEYVLTFFFCLIISLFANCFTEKLELRRSVYYLITVLAVSALLITGVLFANKDEAPDYYLNVALANHEKMDMVGNTEVEITTEYRVNLFEKTVREAAEAGADLLVLAEEYTTLAKEEEAAVLGIFSDIIRENQLPTVVCVDCSGEDGGLNTDSAYLYNSDGEMILKYLKRNLVPFVEAGYYEAGTDFPQSISCMIGGHEISLALIICFDLNDDFLIRKISKGTELLIAPSWDWNYCNYDQKRTRIRSVELNTTLIKHTYDGFSFVSGPSGLTGDYVDNRGQYENVTLVQVPIWEK